MKKERFRWVRSSLESFLFIKFNLHTIVEYYVIKLKKFKVLVVNCNNYDIMIIMKYNENNE